MSNRSKVRHRPIENYRRTFGQSTVQPPTGVWIGAENTVQPNVVLLRTLSSITAQVSFSLYAYTITSALPLLMSLLKPMLITLSLHPGSNVCNKLSKSRMCSTQHQFFLHRICAYKLILMSMKSMIYQKKGLLCKSTC